MNRNYWKQSWTRLHHMPRIMTPLWALGFILLMALIAPFFSSHTYFTNHLMLKNAPPSLQFWFGSDELGRDIFIRIWVGARISLFVGIAAATLDLILGVIYGSIAGMWSGKIDEAMMRFADILYSIPYILVVILLTVFLTPSLGTIILALSITGWIPMSRVVRGQIRLLKELDYAQAAVAIGASKWRLLFRHLLPNALGPIITTMTFTIPTAIFAEAFLSFIGLGVQAPIASWGTMASDGLSALRYYPWRLFFPAFFISLTMFCFNLIGDGIRDAFDPRTKV